MQDVAVLQDWFARFPQRVCEMTVTNLVLWGGCRNHRMGEVEGHLILSFQKQDGPLKFYPPVGPNPARIMREVLPPADGYNYQYVDEEVVTQIPASELLRKTPENDDYVYRVHDLATLAGTPYVSHRNKIKRALKENPVIAPLTVADRDDCLALHQEWLKTQTDPSKQSLKDEVDALILAFDHFDALKLFGVGIRIRNRLVAFGLGAGMNPTMAIEHFEKASTRYTGLYQLTLHEFAKMVPPQHTFLNREEDMGHENLRAVKKGWNPAFMVGKCAYGT